MVKLQYILLQSIAGHRFPSRNVTAHDVPPFSSSQCQLLLSIIGLSCRGTFHITFTYVMSPFKILPTTPLFCSATNLTSRLTLQVAKLLNNICHFGLMPYIALLDMQSVGQIDCHVSRFGSVGKE